LHLNGFFFSIAIHNDQVWHVESSKNHYKKGGENAAYFHFITIELGLCLFGAGIARLLHETGTSIMGLSTDVIRRALDQVAEREPAIRRAIEIAGYPEARVRDPGYTTLLRTIVGQQVSVAAASSVWKKLETALGEGCPADAILGSAFDDLRACGLSRQKTGLCAIAGRACSIGQRQSGGLANR
jgi:hypothetical protein